jgi:hypothetical protein
VDRLIYGDFAVENGIRVIADGAFESCQKITSIILPSSVKYIGKRAFYNCDKIPTVDIPEGVCEIGDEAFYGCENMTSMYLPISVLRIGDSAFKYCFKIKQMELGKNVESIGNEAFAGCREIESLTIPNSVVSWGKNSLDGCTNLTHLVVGDGISYIDASMLKGCKYLKSLVLGRGIDSIGRWSILDDELKLKYLTIKAPTPPKIEEDPFGWRWRYRDENTTCCVPYGSVEVYLASNWKVMMNNYRVYYEPSQLIFYTTTNRNSVRPKNTAGFGARFISSEYTQSGDGRMLFKASIVHIPYGALENCKRMSSIIIPEEVVRIGSYAFSGCKNLVDVTIPASVVAIDQAIFENCKMLQQIEYLGTKKQWGAIQKSKNWRDGSVLRFVKCTDGQVQL